MAFDCVRRQGQTFLSQFISLELVPDCGLQGTETRHTEHSCDSFRSSTPTVCSDLLPGEADGPRDA